MRPENLVPRWGPHPKPGRKNRWPRGVEGHLRQLNFCSVTSLFCGHTQVAERKLSQFLLPPLSRLCAPIPLGYALISHYWVHFMCLFRSLCVNLQKLTTILSNPGKPKALLISPCNRHHWQGLRCRCLTNQSLTVTVTPNAFYSHSSFVLFHPFVLAFSEGFSKVFLLLLTILGLLHVSVEPTVNSGFTFFLYSKLKLTKVIGFLLC